MDDEQATESELGPFWSATVDELAAASVPVPEDLMGDLGPLACLWYSTQCVSVVADRFVATITDKAGGELEDDDPPVRALQAITTALGVLNGACAEIGILPTEAADLPT